MQIGVFVPETDFSTLVEATGDGETEEEYTDKDELSHKRPKG